jgi:hypothetical protein
MKGEYTLGFITQASSRYFWCNPTVVEHVYKCNISMFSAIIMYVHLHVHVFGLW